MKDILGIPMVGHCYFRSKLSRALEGVYIATCDKEIKEYCESIGAPCIMTSNKHERASDRIAEAMLKIENEVKKTCEIVVLIQGDEPMLDPAMVDKLVSELENEPKINVANGYRAISSIKDFEDPNEVKVVLDQYSNAIYFSREPIPSKKKWEGQVSMYKQICIMPFRRQFLLDFNSAPQGNLEKIESIDMLRVLEMGKKVKMVPMENDSFSVDTRSDLSRVRKLMANDSLVSIYNYKTNWRK